MALFLHCSQQKIKNEQTGTGHPLTKFSRRAKARDKFYVQFGSKEKGSFKFSLEETIFPLDTLFGPG